MGKCSLRQPHIIGRSPRLMEYARKNTFRNGKRHLSMDIVRILHTKTLVSVEKKAVKIWDYLCLMWRFYTQNVWTSSGKKLFFNKDFFHKCFLT